MVPVDRSGKKRRHELMAACAQNKDLREQGASEDQLVPLPEYLCPCLR